MAQKLNFEDALQRINDGYPVSAAHVQSRALSRVFWVSEWHIPGCMSESHSFSLTKSDAIESALSFAADECGDAPRGMRADLIRYGRSDKVAKNAYVSMAITTIQRCTLREIL
jgi:hypothetical protein